MRILTLDQAHNAERINMILRRNRVAILDHLAVCPERSLFAWRSVDAIDAALSGLESDLVEFAALASPGLPFNFTFQ